MNEFKFLSLLVVLIYSHSATENVTSPTTASTPTTTDMKSFLVILGVVVAASAQMSGSGGNFNLETQQGILQFLAMEGINPSSLVTSNCIANGNVCSPSGGQQCCLSPVFSCQASSSGNVCLVVPAHVNHIPEIKQIVATEGLTTQNPIL